MQYTTKFQAAFIVAMKHEGGYVWDKDDIGGETNFGITKRTYPNVDIKNLTKDQAAGIYYNDWWLKGPYESLDIALATKVFDTAINMGASRAFKFLQQAANTLGASLSVDGAIGPLSVAAINKLSGASVLKAFRLIQEQYYLDLISARPTLAKFRNGWISRARS